MLTQKELYVLKGFILNPNKQLTFKEIKEYAGIKSHALIQRTLKKQ